MVQIAMWGVRIFKYTVASGDCINLNINNSDVLMYLTMSVLNIDKSQDLRLAIKNRMVKYRCSSIYNHIFSTNLKTERVH